MVPHQSTKFCGPGTVWPTSKCSDNITATDTKTQAVRKKLRLHLIPNKNQLKRPQLHIIMQDGMLSNP